MESKKYIYHVIVMLPDINHDYMFDNYSTALHFYHKKVEQGCDVRMAVTSRC